MRVTRASNYLEHRDSISHDWVKTLEAWQMTPVLIPNVITDPVAYLDDLKPDGLVLTGGEDLGSSSNRDTTEAVMLEHALENNLPVLGICRGMQFINTRLGGALTPVRGHVGNCHDVYVAPRWTKYYGKQVEVNSYHTQGIALDGLAPGLVVTATDTENNIEAYCHQEKPVAAVMWHPERSVALPGDQELIKGLISSGESGN